MVVKLFRETNTGTPATKSALAKNLQVARSTLYYKPKLPTKDRLLKEQILQTWALYPAYGHKRLALYLNTNKKRVLRVMRQFQLKVPRRRVQRPVKLEDLKQAEVRIPNLLRDIYGQPITIPHPDFAWAQDFTYLWFAGRWWYTATVIDLYTREVLGTAFSQYHDKTLILTALQQALTTGRTPSILHSDQGSEYKAHEYWQLVKTRQIQLSYSRKASPWQNSFQESFYNNFKLDLGSTSQFATTGELVEAVYQTIHTYNHYRIHTSLKMSPKQYYHKYQLTAGVEFRKSV